MIKIFGDSHARFNFANLQNPNENYNMSSLTMHRIGRDRLGCINFKNFNVQNGDIIVYQVGEVDARAHCHKQILLGRQLKDIVSELITNFIDSIKENAASYEHLRMIICCIPPTMNQQYYENIYGPITHEFPFVGTNEQRAFYTETLNAELYKQCNINGIMFLDYYDFYKADDGLIRIELTDDICHIKENGKILEIFSNML
jgi:hypothetical protein